MLVAFPVTFYATSVIGFAAYALGHSGFWWQVGLWSNGAGVASAVLAAIPGIIDWLYGIPAGSAAKRAGTKHMLLNLAALLLFACNVVVQRKLWLVGDGAERAALPGLLDVACALALCGLGFALTLLAGFFGWALVQTHHVGIELSEEQKRLEAPRRARRPLVQS
jgi:uncharacterized membrane protein